MPTIYRYIPVIIPGPNGTDYRPFANSNGPPLVELCELDDFRYVVAPDSIEVVVPEEITTWEPVTLTDQLREKLKVVSHYCELARVRFIETIRAKHSLDDELYYARIATGAMMGTYVLQLSEHELLTKYQADVEAARVALHETYSEFGL